MRSLRWMVWALGGVGLVASACSRTDDVRCTGDRLFGRPGERSGLSAEQCAPRCECGGDDWEAPAASASQLSALRAFELTTPFDELTADPYEGPPPSVIANEACAVVRAEPASLRYEVRTFASFEAAAQAGAQVTHGGRCGACSSLADLAVYMENGDLTEPVRQCALQNLFRGQEEHLACLIALGFTRPCAQIWYYNSRHTRQVCADPCFAALEAPYHSPDGALNECLACDERESGPIFKAVAGRTRRNTGLATALCRPCSEVLRISHDY